MTRGPSTIAASLAAIAVFLPGRVIAVPWLEPRVTPMGLMAVDGISPMPTGAPDGLPGDGWLRKRASCTPIPETVCGFISSSSGLPLTCGTGQQCVQNGGNFGCCSNSAVNLCTNIYTTCVPYFAGGCLESCLADPKILKCPLSASECETYSFDGGVMGYSCGVKPGSTNVAWIRSIFTSGCIPESTTASTTSSSSSHSATSGTTTATSTGAAISDSTTTPTSTSSSDGSKLTPGAVAGITIAAIAVLTALAGGILFFYISHKRVTAATAAAAAAAEADNDKSNITSTTGTPPLTQTPSRQSGRPYSIQSTRTPPSGYYAVPTGNPDAVHSVPFPAHSNPALPKKSDMRYSNNISPPPLSTSPSVAAAVAGSPIRGPGPRARRFSTPTPVGGRMSPAEEVPEGGEGEGALNPPLVPLMTSGLSRGVSPHQNPPPVPPPALGLARRASPQQSLPLAPSPAPSGSGSASEMPAVRRFYGVPPS